MTDVFEVLLADHSALRLMLAALETSPGCSDGAGQSVVGARREVVRRLTADTAAHGAAEDECLWPVVRARVAHGDQLADQGIGQEQDTAARLDQLSRLDAADPEFDQLIDALIPVARRHFEFEETQVWPALRDALSRAESRELAARVEQAKDTADR